jgi:predicted nucleic acid-binding protein
VRVLFDSNVLVYWMGGNQRFKPSLGAFLSRHRDLTKFISTVTLQELLVYTRTADEERRTNDFLRGFQVLPFDEPTARAARDLSVSIELSRGAKQADVDVWQRDLSILATAVTKNMAAIVTANGRDFVRYQDSVTVKIEVITAVERR